MINNGNSIKKCYWDIDDILAEEEMVNVKFNSVSKMNGLLDINKQYVENEESDIPQGTVLALPYWLSIDLSKQKVSKSEDTPHIDIEIPKYFQVQFQNTLNYDPTMVNLKEKTLYFYELAFKISEYQDDFDFVKTLLETFLARMKEFSMISQHSLINDCGVKMKRMANLELNQFNEGRQSALAYRDWKKNGLTLYKKTGLKIQKIRAK